MGAEV